MINLLGLSARMLAHRKARANRAGAANRRRRPMQFDGVLAHEYRVGWYPKQARAGSSAS
jgi:hypothetical protein